MAKRLLINDGDIFGNFKVIGIDDTAERTHQRITSQGRKLLTYIAECTNCGFRHSKTTSDLTRSSRGNGVKEHTWMVCRRCKGRGKGEAGLNELFRTYKHNASLNNRDFLLTLEEFKNITSSPCHYCGATPVCIQKGFKRAETEWGSYAYNGIDRMDNSQGYVPNNVAPCCIHCNWAKQDRPYEEFVKYVSMFADNCKNGKVQCLKKNPPPS